MDQLYMNNDILLIDGSSFIFRAFYAIKNLTATNGMPTNAIYGVVSMLKQLQKKYSSQYWVCVFDAKGKNFRDEIYPEYKANRRTTPSELISQFVYIYQVVQALGIPMIIQEGVEADDVIATIAQYYAKQNYSILICTGDKDFAQIVTDKINLVNTMTDEILNIEGVVNKFGVKPEQIIDYLCLVGDSADNIPGITKCGPKTAAKWLNQFGNLDNLLTNQATLSGAVGENLRNEQAKLSLAKQLITIKCDVQIDVFDITNLANLACKPANLIELEQIYQHLNFRTWLNEVRRQLASTRSNQEGHQQELIISQLANDQASINNLNHAKNYQLITKPSELKNLVEQLLTSNMPSAFSLILDNYTLRNSLIQCIALSHQCQDYLIQCSASQIESKQDNDLFSTPAELDNANSQLWELLKPYWQSDCPKICYNYKDNLAILATYQIQLNGVIGDLQLISYVQNSLNIHKLSAIISRCLPDIEPIQDYVDLLGKGSKQQLLSNLESKQQLEFSWKQVRFMLNAYQIILQQLTPAEQNLYHNIELPLAKLLLQMEQVGIMIDLAHLAQLAKQLNQEMEQLEQQIFHQANCAFNLNSPKQVQDVLFNQLGLPTQGIKKNSNGYSSGEDSLLSLADAGFNIANLILAHRSVAKLINTYIQPLQECADSQDLVHTTFEQTIVTSGRLSSQNPNLQNIPIRNDYGQQIRECFIAPSGYKLIGADYSQIELRILAHLSQDNNLIHAFKTGADIHRATASQIFNLPLEQVSKEQRRYAKTINFGLIYGKSVFGLAKELKIEQSAADTYIKNYFAQYPLVSQFMTQIKQDAFENGYVETILGRKIFLKNIRNSNYLIRQAEERLALNAPMQGSGADIIKLAMLKINAWLAQQQLATKIILQVHDELILLAPIAEVELVIANLAQLMTQVVELAVPLEVAIQVADNWGLAH
jgi:DNA polymerase-1